jgi:hypothetical protein
MHFYTNVQNHGSKILIREYKDGVRQKLRLDYKPSLFHETRETNTKYKSLDGKSLKRVVFPSIPAARGKIKESEGLTAWYGMNQFIRLLSYRIGI